MLGLYQDPEGDNVKIVTTEVPHRDQAYTPEEEIRKLRRRISELERSQQTSKVYALKLLYFCEQECTHHLMNVSFVDCACLSPLCVLHAILYSPVRMVYSSTYILC